jgi:hypothetical protein
VGYGEDMLDDILGEIQDLLDAPAPAPTPTPSAAATPAAFSAAATAPQA